MVTEEVMIHKHAFARICLVFLHYTFLSDVSPTRGKMLKLDFASEIIQH